MGFTEERGCVIFEGEVVVTRERLRMWTEGTPECGKKLQNAERGSECGLGGS